MTEYHEPIVVNQHMPQASAWGGMLQNTHRMYSLTLPSDGRYHEVTCDGVVQESHAASLPVIRQEQGSDG